MAKLQSFIEDLMFENEDLEYDKKAKRGKINDIGIKLSHVLSARSQDELIERIKEIQEELAGIADAWLRCSGEPSESKEFD